MQVKEVMTRDFEMIESSASLTAAAMKMKSLDVGVLPVSEGDKIVGMLTDRDIVIRALAEDIKAHDVTVKEIMTPRIVYCSEDENIEDAAAIMRDKKIRRLIVLDYQDIPVGIVSLGDIAAKAHSELLVGQALEDVSQPCHPSR